MGNSETRLRKSELDRLHEKLHLPKEKILYWHSIYKHNCKTNKNALTVSEFKKLYNEIADGDASKFAENVFRVFDRDHNGTVDFEEFLVGLENTSSTDIATKLEWVFEMYDIDGDGSITPEEMTSIIESMCSMYSSVADTPGNTSATQITDRLFKKMDTNNDGVISREEFVKAGMNDPDVLDILQWQSDDPETTEDDRDN